MSLKFRCSSDESESEEEMKFSDVEDNQQMAIPFEDDEPPPPEAKLSDLADMYMMKSPVTLALKRKSISN